MNQFELEALRIAAGVFVVFCIAFCLRRKSAFWGLLPRIVMISCVGWFISSLIVIATLQNSSSQGVIFGFAYFAVVLMTPPLLAVGAFEFVLGAYVSLVRDARREHFVARSHFNAALVTFVCIGAYVALSQFSM